MVRILKINAIGFWKRNSGEVGVVALSHTMRQRVSYQDCPGTGRSFCEQHGPEAIPAHTGLC